MLLCKEVLTITNVQDAIELALAVFNLHRVIAAMLRLAPAMERRTALNVPLTRRWVRVQRFAWQQHSLPPLLLSAYSHSNACIITVCSSCQSIGISPLKQHGRKAACFHGDRYHALPVALLGLQGTVTVKSNCIVKVIDNFDAFKEFYHSTFDDIEVGDVLRLHLSISYCFCLAYCLWFSTISIAPAFISTARVRLLLF